MTPTIKRETTFGTEPSTVVERFAAAVRIAGVVTEQSRTLVCSGTFTCECGGSVGFQVADGGRATGVPCNECDRSYTVEGYSDRRTTPDRREAEDPRRAEHRRGSGRRTGRPDRRAPQG